MPASTFPNATGVDPNAQVPNFINAAWFQQTRKRDSVAANLQFKPNDDLEFNLSGLYIKENFANYNQSMYNFLSLTPGEVDQLTVGADGIVTGGHSGPGSSVFYDNNVRASEPTTKGLDLKVDYSGDGWDLSGQIGQSKSDNELKQWFIEPAFTGGFSWDINRGITFDDPAAARDPANWAGAGFFGNHGIFSTESKDNYGQVDFSKQFDSVFNELQVGVRRQSTKRTSRSTSTASRAPPTCRRSAPSASPTSTASRPTMAAICMSVATTSSTGSTVVRRTSPTRMRPASSTTPTRSSRPTLRPMRS